jgi:hypothetical protein
MIPGKAPADVSPSDDISIIDRQHGIIAIKTAPVSEGALNAVLSVREKLGFSKLPTRKTRDWLQKSLAFRSESFSTLPRNFGIVGIGWPTLIQTRLLSRASTLPEFPRTAGDTQGFW